MGSVTAQQLPSTTGVKRKRQVVSHIKYFRVGEETLAIYKQNQADGAALVSVW